MERSHSHGPLAPLVTEIVGDGEECVEQYEGTGQQQSEYWSTGASGALQEGYSGEQQQQQYDYAPRYAQQQFERSAPTHTPQPQLPPVSTYTAYGAYQQLPMPQFDSRVASQQAHQYSRSTLYPQNESFGVPSNPSSFALSYPYQHPSQQPIQLQLPPVSHYPSQRTPYSYLPPFQLPQHSATSHYASQAALPAFTQYGRPRTFTNSSNESAFSTSTDSSASTGLTSGYFDASTSTLGGGWQAEPLSMDGAAEQEEAAGQEAQWSFAAGMEQYEQERPRSAFTSHASAEARGGFLLRGDEEQDGVRRRSSSSEEEVGQHFEFSGEGQVKGEEEGGFGGAGEGDAARDEIAEQLFGLKYGSYGGGGGGGSSTFTPHLSSPDLEDFGDEQPGAEPSSTFTPQHSYADSSTLGTSARDLVARLFAPRPSTTPTTPPPTTASPVQLVTPAPLKSFSSSSSLSSLSSSSSTRATPVKSATNIAPSGGSTQYVGPPKSTWKSASSFFGTFQQQCGVFDGQGKSVDLKPELTSPGFTYENALSAWIGYRRNYMAMSSSIALPGAATPLHLSSMPSSSTRISHFTATITVLTLPTHFEVPLLQLDTTRKLERATPLQPSTFALSHSATQSGKGERATAPFIRVQFRNSTANHPSGATSVGGMTPRFAMRVVVDAILVEGGRRVEVGRWESDELCVRGRSPKNFGVVTAKRREMAVAKGSSATAGVGKAPKEKSKAKAKGKGKGKAGRGKGTASRSSDEEDEEGEEDELDAEDEYLANIAAQKAASALASAAASTSTVPTKRDIEITWDDYEEESLTVAKRTRSSSRR